MRSAAQAFVALATFLSAAPAGAQVIGPGQDGLVRQMLSVSAQGCSFFGASIEEESVRGFYHCPGADVEVRLEHLERVLGEARLTDYLAIQSDTAPVALLDAIEARVRRHGRAFQWSRPEVSERRARATSSSGRPRPKSDGVGARARRWATWALIAIALLGLWGRKPTHRSSRRDRITFAAILVAFVVVAIFLPQWGSFHEHHTFLARSDCAVDIDCDEDRPGWLPPAYHAYEILIAPMASIGGYGSKTLSLLSLLLTVLALTVQHWFLRRWLEHEGDVDAGRRIAFAATIATAFHPAVLRVSVAFSFWPWAMLCFWSAAWLALEAVERGGWHRWLSAGCALALTLGSSVALAPWLLVVGAAPWVFRSRERWLALALLPIVLVLAAYLIPFALELEELPPRPLLEILMAHIYGEPRVTAFTLSLLALVGMVELARRPRFGAILLPLALAQVALVCRFETGYPTQLIHGYPLAFVLGAWVAFGVDRLACALHTRWHHQAAALVLACAMAAWPSAHEGWRALRQPRPVAAELRTLEKALHNLPPHRLLVVAPDILEPLPGARFDGDPIEARFPFGFYEAAMRSRDIQPAPVMRLDEWLAHPTTTNGTVFYIGSSLMTFHPSEMQRGVPSDHSRPLLTELRQAVELRPLVTFEIPTANHPASANRLAADGATKVTLGFYFAEPAEEGR